MNANHRWSFIAATLVLAACGGESVIGSGNEGTSFDGISADGGNPFGPPWYMYGDSGVNCPSFFTLEEGSLAPACRPAFGVCQIPCSSDADCPTADKDGRYRSFCRNPVPGDSPLICVLPCDSASCPEGMVCRTPKNGIPMCFFDVTPEELPQYCTADAAAQ